MRIFLLPFLAVLAGCSLRSGGPRLHHPDLRLAELANKPSGSNAIFKVYQQRGNSTWDSGWPWMLDLSGIAWDRSNTATVITPRHVVMAAHYPRKPGQQIIFHDRRGKPHFRRIQRMIALSDRGLAADIAIGLLDKPLPAKIRQYPLPEPSANLGKEIVGAPVLVTEQNRKLYVHRIAGVNFGRLQMEFDPGLPKHSSKRLIVGDSGHPAFVLSRRELVLIETHSSGGPGAGPFYGDPQIQKKIREIVSELDSSYSIRTTPIDR